MSDAEAMNRLGPRSKERLEAAEREIADLKRSVIALLKAMKDIEETNDEAHMPEGTYHGETFEE